MATSIENLYSRLLQAEEALGEFSLKLISNLGTGNKSRKSIKEFNLLSAWVDLLKSKVKLKKNIVGKSPSPITVTDIYASEGQSVTLGIDDLEGKFTPLFNIPSFNVNTWEADMKASAELLSPRTGILFSNGKFTFPKTDKFNGQSLSHNILIGGNIIVSPEIVDGGITPDIFISGLTAENIRKYNTLLEVIAIKLNLVYISYDRVDINTISNNRNSLEVSASTAILSHLGDTLTDENGNTLEL